MKSALAWLVVAGLMIAFFVHYGAHLPSSKALVATPLAEQTEPASASGPDSEKMITMVGPLAQFMDEGKPQKAVEGRPVRKPDPSDHIAPSPVGTSTAIVHKTFSISTSVNFPFAIPAHAVNAQLRGNYRSFVAQQGIQAGNNSADVACLLMNEQQYAGFLSGHGSDTLMSLEPSHDQDVNFGLPASRDQVVKYYLVFSNNPSEGRKIVQADFKVDF